MPNPVTTYTKGSLTSPNGRTDGTYLRTVDLGFDYEGMVNGTSGIVREGVDAHQSRVLFWLTSKPCDYVGEGAVGGVLYELIGKGLNEETCSHWADYLTEQFNKTFTVSGVEYITLNYCSVTYNAKNRSAIVEMWCTDPDTKKKFKSTIEVEE